VISLTRRRALAGLSTLAVVASTMVGAAVANPASGNLPPRWVGTWGTALTAASLANTGGSLAGFSNQTIREVVRTSVGGEKVRLRLTNAYGTGTLTVGHVTVGLPATAGSADLVAGSVREVTFNGSASTTIYKGADVLSDPVDLDVANGSELALTMYLPVPTGPVAWHWTARQTAFVYDGDHASDPAGAGYAKTYTSFYIVAGVEVASTTAFGTTVVFGDSISDGNGATFGANTRWPDLLANRINGTAPAIGDTGVLNEGIAGNRITRDGLENNLPALGNSALARLDTDVFGQPNVRSVIVELGINDIQFTNPTDPADKIIAGLRQLAAQLKGHGVRTVVTTLGPFEGYPSWNADREAVRLAVNDYLRSQDDFDYLVDMDQILRDPAAPSKVIAAFDCGDHIHPNDAGAAAIANAVPLWLL